MVVTQHSGDGKANQYFLRGFNLDHGTDFAFSVDGVPVNLPSHAHGQGYSDLNFLIPELVDAIDFEKGPFYAEVGDFSGAGAANIHLVNTLPEGIANVQLGQFGYARALLADSPTLGPGTLLYAFEYNHYDGPWDLPESSNRYNALLRYHWDHGRDTFNLTGSVYWAPFWQATDQVAERAVDDGLIGRFGAIDQTDGGKTGRAALAFDWNRNDGDTVTRLLLYGFYYRLNLWSDFTYALSCPPDTDSNCDQFEQIDRRFVQGGELKRTLGARLVGEEGREHPRASGAQRRHPGLRSQPDVVAADRARFRSPIRSRRPTPASSASARSSGRPGSGPSSACAATSSRSTSTATPRRIQGPRWRGS